MFVGSKFLALFALISAACALPSSVPVLDSIPITAVKIAHDPDLDVVVAYDAEGHILGQLPASVGLRLMKRDPGPCVTMSPDDIQKLPGWEKLAQYARDNWGGDWDTIDANPKEYPENYAQLCVAGDITPVTRDGEPQCRTQSQSTGGTIVGTDGTVTLSATQGTTQTTTVTVTQESSLAVGASVSAKFEVPIAEITAELTTTVTFTNTLSTATTFTSTNAQTQTVMLQNEAGKTCSLNFDVQSCDVPGSGSMRLLASGWAWVYYGSRRDGHYKWAISMDSILNEQERETFIGFKTSTSSSTSAQYNAVCQ